MKPMLFERLRSPVVRPYLIALVLFLAAAGVWYVNYSRHFSGLGWSDSHDYNQMARNIYEGKGFSTSVLRPISFLRFQTLPHPEITRPPLYPYLLAGAYALFGVNDLTVVGVNGFFYALLVCVSYLLARALSRNSVSAAIIALCMLLAPLSLKYSIIGSSDIVYMAFATFFFFVYVRHPNRPFLHGLICGVLALTRMNTLFLVAALLLFEYNPFPRGRTFRSALWFLTGLVLMMSPSVLRNMTLGGAAVSSVNSAGLIMFTRSLPGYTYWVQLNPVPVWDFIRTHPAEIYDKLVLTMYGFIFDFGRTYGILMLLLMAAGAVLPQKDEAHRRLRRVILLTALIQTVVIVPISAEARYYMFLLPVLVALCGVFAERIRRSFVRYAALCLVLCLVIASSVAFWKKGHDFNLYRYLGNVAAAETSPGSVIASDQPWAVSWYGDRKTIWLPYDLDTMHRISEKIPIDYVLLSADLAFPFVPYKDDLWQRLYFFAGVYKVPDFRLVKTIVLNGRMMAALYKVEGSPAQ